MSDTLQLSLGQERAIHLPPIPDGDWDHAVEGMASSVDVRKLWRSAPYPEDDEEEAPREAQDVVFMVRAMSPGSATIRFKSQGSTTSETREVEVTVRGR